MQVIKKEFINIFCKMSTFGQRLTFGQLFPKNAKWWPKGKNGKNKNSMGQNLGMTQGRSETRTGTMAVQTKSRTGTMVVQTEGTVAV
jgi:hypothetical protein